MQSQRDDKAILWYLGFVILFSAPFWAIAIINGLFTMGGRYIILLMWAPTAAALLTTRLRGLSYRDLGLRWGDTRYEAMGYLTPLAYATIAYALIWGLGIADFGLPDTITAIGHRMGWTSTDPGTVMSLFFILTATTGIFSSVASALGEEIGWRGFMTPRLVGRFGFLKGGMIAGLIWGAWHMPLLLFSDYNKGAPWWFSMSCFLTMTVAQSVILAWLRMRSNSVWPAAIFHGAHNLFIQSYFTPLTDAKPGSTAIWFIDEFGVAVPAISVIFAIAFWWAWKNGSGLRLGDQTQGDLGAASAR